MCKLDILMLTLKVGKLKKISILDYKYYCVDCRLTNLIFFLTANCVPTYK